MTVSLIQPSFATGEITPSLFGRVDLAKWHVSAATMRNFFVNYRGGASSRGGTAFVGCSKQPGTSYPPRLIKFQFSLNQGLNLEFGHLYIRVISNGAYVTETAKNITGITNASPAVVTSVGHGFSNGDQVYIANVGGMVELNGNIYTISGAGANTFTLTDMFGNVVDSSLFGVYTSGGTASRIYTITSPYSAVDLPALKFTQSADVMSFTHPLYAPYTLTRISSASWTMAATSFGSKIAAPTNLTATPSTKTTGTILYVAVTAGGAGYTQPPRATITTSTGHGAVLATTITGGAVVDVTVISPGWGYVPGDTVTIGGAATANLVIGPSPVDPTVYQYVVTAIDSITGEESVASNIAETTSSVNISLVQGVITLTWSAVAGADSYRIYKAPATFLASPPEGSLFGYIGTALGNRFVDNNISSDFAITPPLHINPFAPGQVLSLTMTNQGAGYTSNPVVTITTGTGAGVVLQAVVVGGAVQAVIVINGGHDYRSTDTLVFTGGGGAAAAGTVNVGPLTGTYPSCVAYFQQRRVYANTLNNPDTYFMSQSGAYTNLDISAIPLDSDAVIGTPWAQQVNGIQALVPMPSGLIVLTGLGAWQVSGGGVQQPITPTSQSAQPQAYNGCHDHIQPIVINYDVLYVQAKGSIVRDLAYNVFVNIYTGTDLSILSNHLFEGHQLVEWAWSEEPFKVIWAVRDDGVMLSLTYLKEQEVQGWARHDTQGLFVSVNSVTEYVQTISGGTYVDVVYVAVKRYIQNQWLYYIERMDPRIWNVLEDSWCLDSALSLPNPTPAATLTASQATFPGRISNTVTVTYGGSGYTNPSLIIVDPFGDGSGAILIPTVVGGVITAITVSAQGSGYVNPQIVVEDSTGNSAVIQIALDNTITFTASSAIFTAANVGDVIRMGGGVATITTFTSTTVVEADLSAEITKTIPDNPNNIPLPAISGTWTLTTPATTVRGLSHLEGQDIMVLADGNVVDGLSVTNGAVTLETEASSILVGLPFTAQLQSLYTDIPGEATVEGKSKNIYAVTVRVRDSRGIQIGSNQVDSSTQANGATVPWSDMIEVKERGNNVNAGTAIPLFTGDERVAIPANWSDAAQVAVQQVYPLPANILAFIPEVQIGDTNG